MWLGQEQYARALLDGKVDEKDLRMNGPGEIKWKHFPELCDGRPELRIEPQFWSEENPLRIKTDVVESYEPDELAQAL